MAYDVFRYKLKKTAQAKAKQLRANKNYGKVTIHKVKTGYNIHTYLG